jgi:hypothetical protein
VLRSASSEYKRSNFYIENNIFYFSNIDYTHFNVFLLFEVSLSSVLGALVSIFLFSFIWDRKVQVNFKMCPPGTLCNVVATHKFHVHIFIFIWLIWWQYACHTSFIKPYKCNTHICFILKTIYKRLSNVGYILRLSLSKYIQIFRTMKLLWYLDSILARKSCLNTI